MSKSYINNSRINLKIQTNSHAILIRRYLTTLLPLSKKHAVKNSQHQETLLTSLKKHKNQSMIDWLTNMVPTPTRNSFQDS